MIPYLFHVFIPTSISSLHDNKPVYRLPQQSIYTPYSVFCSISFRCGRLCIERNQKPLITLVATHHDRQKQVEVKRSSRVNLHEIRILSGFPYYSHSFRQIASLFIFIIKKQAICRLVHFSFKCLNTAKL